MLLNTSKQVYRFIQRSLFSSFSHVCSLQVTGAGHGIGRETCYLYAEQRAILVLWDIDEKGILETKKLLEDRGYHKVYTYR